MVKNKKYTTLAVLTAALLFVAGIGAGFPAAIAAAEAPAPLLLTLEELKAFNGMNGQPAYIALDGIIYDVTGNKAWSSGVHKGFEAGNDLTADFKEKSPHDLGILEGSAQVGRVKILLTLEQLKEFNGKDGKPAYVAVDGIVYDMTASRAWGNGNHNGFEAGNDLTAAIKEKSPHGVGKLANVVEVGRVKIELTLEQLREFNGKDGKPAYVAVDGIIYDMTASMKWGNGDHNGFEAGNDLTQAIKERSPHGVGKLKNVIEIGVLIP